MKNYHNIEKSGFHRGQYVGYGGGQVYRIIKRKTGYGNWLACNQKDPKDQITAFTLAGMSNLLDILSNEVKV